MDEPVSQILTAVKLDLGIRSSAKDATVQDSILSALHELRLHGMSLVNETDPLTAQAIKLYCRGWFNFQGDGERYMKAFEHLADGLALSGDYSVVQE